MPHFSGEQRQRRPRSGTKTTKLTHKMNFDSPTPKAKRNTYGGVHFVLVQNLNGANEAQNGHPLSQQEQV